MIEVCGYKAFYGTIVTFENKTIGPCNFIFLPDDEVWLSEEGDTYYKFEVTSVLPYVNISKCNGEPGNPDCDTQDLCSYEVVETHDNVRVEIARCRKCGNIDVSWYRGITNESLGGEYE